MARQPGRRVNVSTPPKPPSEAAAPVVAAAGVVPNVGHASNVEAPAAFNTAVRTFLHTIVA